MTIICASVRQLLRNLYILFRRHAFLLSILLLGVIAGFVVALTLLTSILTNSEMFSAVGNRIGFSAISPTINKPIALGNAVGLAKEVRILCWVMTNPKNHWKRTQFVKRTWGPHCNILLFMSSESEPVLGTISLSVEEGRNHLWYKVRAAFRYVHKHHLHDADFFMKADDDSFVIAENMRMMLQGYSADDPVWFGCRFHLPGQNHDQGYMSGGSGYVLSREAVIRFVEIAFPNKNLCVDADIENEDVEVGVCLANVNVTTADTRDKHLKGRFMPFSPGNHLHHAEDKNYWYWIYRYYGSALDMNDNCSSSAVSFHYIDPWNMVVMHYLLYNVTRYGVEDKYLQLPREHPNEHKYENLVRSNFLHTHPNTTILPSNPS